MTAPSEDVEALRMAAFYVDRGWSTGMYMARDTYEKDGIPYVIRWILPD